VNSEELEQSLRTEFESYLKDIYADMRQEFSQFREKIEAESDRHKSQLDEAFQDFSARHVEEKSLELSFTESVVEHLRLARDEGARITATAMEKAEEMQREFAETAEPAAPTIGISELRDAINDISSKNTQSSILKALVQNAGQFTPRGAFFIIKNEHLVGWRVFGKEGYSDEQTVREVFFPVAASTVLGESVRSLSAVESAFGAYSEDFVYLNKLEFGQPEKMFAFPLVVRGRSVAVLYADNGNDGNEVNIEALETLARVASLTVEVLASARPAKPEAEEKPKFVEEVQSFDGKREFESAEAETETVEEIEQPVEEISEFASPSFEAPIDSSFEQQDFETVQPQSAEEFSSEEPVEETKAESEFAEPQEEFQPIEADTSWNEPAAEAVEARDEAQFYEPVAETSVTEDFSTPSFADYQFETNEVSEPAAIEFEDAAQDSEPVSFDEVKPSFEPAALESNQFEPVETFTAPQDGLGTFEPQNGKAESFVPETVETISEPTPAQSVKTRFSDRNVDLPIEVGEEERRLHNDARRFARLLVSEIKLYNEQKVKEGREASDLYERLREAIDRSREMYDKRVQPPVAARFDYFHYEVVNTLAEGDENKLGESYPGAVV
jgi:hypothetical protein